ncbi:MAG TPA: lipid-binding SYLF domain-containing protein [Burkholderiales bacterium]|jgi:lipid-binding SYLF domain-containing protein
MNARLRSIFVLFLLILPFGHAVADAYDDTLKLFREANESRPFFDKSYGYAVFPTVGKGGYVIGGAYGKGRVYRGGTHVGDTQMSQLTVGFQLGGQAYSQIIFFEDRRAFDEFTSGNFEFGAQASAVAVTAGASVQLGTSGASASASGTQHYAKHATPGYHKGMAVFTLAKGGLMYEASIGGQRFDYARKGEQLTRSASPEPVEGEVMP